MVVRRGGRKTTRKRRTSKASAESANARSKPGAVDLDESFRVLAALTLSGDAGHILDAFMRYFVQESERIERELAALPWSTFDADALFLTLVRGAPVSKLLEERGSGLGGALGRVFFVWTMFRAPLIEAVVHHAIAGSREALNIPASVFEDALAAERDLLALELAKAEVDRRAKATPVGVSMAMLIARASYGRPELPAEMKVSLDRAAVTIANKTKKKLRRSLHDEVLGQIPQTLANPAEKWAGKSVRTLFNEALGGQLEGLVPLAVSGDVRNAARPEREFKKRWDSFTLVERRSDDPTPFELTGRSELFGTVVARLTPTEVEAVRGHVEGKPLSEVAKGLGITPTGLKKRLRKHLSVALKPWRHRPR